MSVATALDAIDRSLRAAVAERNRQLKTWARCPSTENHAAYQRAVDELDVKLEQRYAAQ